MVWAAHGAHCLGVKSRVKRHVQHKIPEQALVLFFPVADGATLRKTVVMLPRKMQNTFNPSKLKHIYDFTKIFILHAAHPKFN